MVGKKIRAYREFRGYSQIQLAELSGINVGTIRKYELGIRNPKPNQLEKIATALGLNVSVFLDFNIETVGDVLSLLFSQFCLYIILSYLRLINFSSYLI